MAVLKADGVITDYSFNAEICKLPVDALAKVIVMLMPEHERKQLEKRVRGKDSLITKISVAIKEGTISAGKEVLSEAGKALAAPAFEWAKALIFTAPFWLQYIK